MLSLRDKARHRLRPRPLPARLPRDRRRVLRHLAPAHPPDRPRHPPLLGARHRRRAQRHLRQLLHPLRRQGLPRVLPPLARRPAASASPPPRSRDFFAPVAAHAIALGVDLRLNTPADPITPLPNHRWRITTGTSRHIEADAVILATDLRQATASRPPRRHAEAHLTRFGCDGSAASSQALGSPPTPLDPAQFTTAPITTIHLWYDREITALDHAVLLDTRIQWLFNKSRIRNWPASRGTYLELVISASHAELHLSREQILADALAELALFFPASPRSQTPQIRRPQRSPRHLLRHPRSRRPPPTQTTAHPNLYLAGDYTATDWPSTMESAVRSGRLAAALAAGHPRTHFLSPGLPATGLMRLLTRR